MGNLSGTMRPVKRLRQKRRKHGASTKQTRPQRLDSDITRLEMVTPMYHDKPKVITKIG